MSLSPLLSVLLAAHLVDRGSGVNVPAALHLVFAILSWSLALALHTTWVKWNNAGNTAARDAVKPPRVECRLPGGLDMAKEYVRYREDRFLGAYHVGRVYFSRFTALYWAGYCAME